MNCHLLGYKEADAFRLPSLMQLDDVWMVLEERRKMYVSYKNTPKKAIQPANQMTAIIANRK